MDPESLHQFLDGGVKVRSSFLGPLLVPGNLEVPQLLRHALPDGLEQVQSELVRNQSGHLQEPLDYQRLESGPVKPWIKTLEWSNGRRRVSLCSPGRSDGR